MIWKQLIRRKLLKQIRSKKSQAVKTEDGVWYSSCTADTVRKNSDSLPDQAKEYVRIAENRMRFLTAELHRKQPVGKPWIGADIQPVIFLRRKTERRITYRNSG